MAKKTLQELFASRFALLIQISVDFIKPPCKITTVGKKKMVGKGLGDSKQSQSIGRNQEEEVGTASAATGCQERLVTSCLRTETVYHTLRN